MQAPLSHLFGEQTSAYPLWMRKTCRCPWIERGKEGSGRDLLVVSYCYLFCMRTLRAWEMGWQSRRHSQVTIGGFYLCFQTGGSCSVPCGLQPSSLILRVWNFCLPPPPLHPFPLPPSSPSFPSSSSCFLVSI